MRNEGRLSRTRHTLRYHCQPHHMNIFFLDEGRQGKRERWCMGGEWSGKNPSGRCARMLAYVCMYGNQDRGKREEGRRVQGVYMWAGKGGLIDRPCLNIASQKSFEFDGWEGTCAWDWR